MDLYGVSTMNGNKNSLLVIIMATFCFQIDFVLSFFSRICSNMDRDLITF